MSCWTYVAGWIECCPAGRTQEEKEYILKTVLNHLPVVSGSEEDMYVHIIKAGGHDISHYRDEYGNQANNIASYGTDGSQKRGCYRHLEIQSTYYLFVEGHFRDTTFSGQYKQIIKWLTRLSKRISVDLVHILFTDTPGRFITIDNDFSGLYECPSWTGDKSTNWCEHLMWKEDPNGKDR